nr:splicing factor 1-like isoform X2 [Dermatophagoides pteronyssinus]
MEKVYVPVDEHPDFNFVGRILGPRGMTAKQLEQETGCKIMVRGRGSMRDKKKEEQNRGKPNWEHLNDKLHVLITVEDTENRAQLKMERAIEEVKKLLVPITEGEDELKKRQLMELAIINGTYRDSGQRNNSANNNVVATATSPNLIAAQHLVNMGLDPEQLGLFANNGNGNLAGGGGGSLPMALAAAAAAAAAATHPHSHLQRHHPLTPGHHSSHHHHHQPSPIGAPLILTGTPPTARQFAHTAAASPSPHQSLVHPHPHQALLNGNAAAAMQAAAVAAAASLPPQLITATSTPDGTLLYTTNVHPSALNHHTHPHHPHQYATTAAEFHHQYAASLAAAQLLDYQNAVATAAAAVGGGGQPILQSDQSTAAAAAASTLSSSASSSSSSTTSGLKEKRQTIMVSNPSLNGLRNVALMNSVGTVNGSSSSSSITSTSTTSSTLTQHNNHRYHPYDNHHHPHPNSHHNNNHHLMRTAGNS